MSLFFASTGSKNLAGGAAFMPLAQCRGAVVFGRMPLNYIISEGTEIKARQLCTGESGDALAQHCFDGT